MFGRFPDPQPVAPSHEIDRADISLVERLLQGSQKKQVAGRTVGKCLLVANLPQKQNTVHAHRKLGRDILTIGL
jgi:hypothetical protein